MVKGSHQGMKRVNVSPLGRESDPVDLMLAEISDVSPPQKGSIEETTYQSMSGNPIP